MLEGGSWTSAVWNVHTTMLEGGSWTLHWAYQGTNWLKAASVLVLGVDNEITACIPSKPTPSQACEHSSRAFWQVPWRPSLCLNPQTGRDWLHSGCPSKSCPHTIKTRSLHTWERTGWPGVWVGTPGGPWRACEGSRCRSRPRRCGGVATTWACRRPDTLGSKASPWPLQAHRTILHTGEPCQQCEEAERKSTFTLG